MSLFTPSNTWKQEEHEIFSDNLSRFFDKHMVPNIEKWYDDGKVEKDFWNKAGEAGILGCSVPEAYGGSGGGYTFDGLVIYHMSNKGESGWGFGIQSFVLHYLLTYGSDEQKSKFIPDLVSGKRIAGIAMTEPGTGSDLQAIKTTAKKDGEHYILNGSKTFITNGQTANLILVVAKTDTSPSAGAKGVSLLLLETDNAEGFKRGRNLKKLGNKSNDTSELFFDNVKVPESNLLGIREGMGFPQLMQQLPWERLAIAIGALGAIDFAIDETVRYAKERIVFGKPLLNMQNTRFKLAECKTKAELLRTFVNDCLARIEAGKLDAATASMAKYWGTEAQNEVMNDCLQIHGGYGYMMEYPIARLYGDARVQMIYGGANEIMKELIARTLEM